MPRVQFIFFTIFLDALGIGLLIPVLPDILRRFTTEPAEVTLYYGYFLSAYAAMQFLASPVLGSLSDRFGRRPILLVSLLGAGIDYLFMAYAPSLVLLFIGRIISGLTGASMTVASSYMVDISDDSNRSKNFGLIGAGWALGFIIGPVMGGVFQQLGPNGPFLIAAALNLLNFAFGIFVLPESLPLDQRRPLRLKGLNPFLSLLKILRPSPIASSIWIYFLLFFSGQVHPVNWTLYTENRFGWSAWQVGISLAAVGVCNAATQALLPRFLIPKLGEMHSFLFGTVFSVLGFFLFGFIPEGWMAYPVILVFSLSAVAFPALQSIISRSVGANQQGELQGSLVSLGSLSAIIAPFFFSNIFVAFSDRTKTYIPGAAYYAAALICLIGLGIGLRKAQKSPRTQTAEGGA